MSSSESLPQAPTLLLQRRHFFWLTLAYMALVAVCAHAIRIDSRSDWLANILLYMPLGFLGMATLAADRSWPSGLAAALLVVPLCGVLSAAIEFTQLYFPERVASLSDVAANTMGGCLGVLLWLCAGRQITRRLRRAWAALGQQGIGARLLPFYLCFLLFMHALPFDLSLSPVEMYHKYKRGQIQLIPFANSGTPFRQDVQKILTELLYYLPVGLLLTAFRRPLWRQWQNWPIILGLGLGLAGLVEFMKLFVRTRFSTSTDVIVGGLGVVAGWAIGLTYLHLQPPAEPAGQATSQDASAKGLGRRVLLAGLLGAWFLLQVYMNWQPFDFSADAGRRLGEISLLPFADYQRGNYINALEQILSKAFFFAPLGVILAAFSSRAQQSVPLLLVLGTAALLALVFETGQLFVPGRYASVSDVMIETAGAWLGFVVARRALGTPA